MSEELIIRHGSPTLAGMKSGSLFSCPYRSKKAVLSELRRLNRLLGPKGLRVLPLRFFSNRVLIYLYRPNKLKEDLSHVLAEPLLKRCGYEPCSPSKCIAELSKKLHQSEDFPHEIGLFLGYPPEDVCGFIDNKACGYKCVGCWKVYGDEEAALKTFAKYNKCTKIYGEKWRQGTPIERLAVSC